ncbi:phage virion morphogenesis protein [Clostridium lundense]|uniref:phage virion morphogenesis protein n=1 Tax=Clostridium lundense TaxID=319475 RepID=UPI00068855DD|nr:phage virion morphogenesis protein [Clostridium lundense]
MVKPIDVKIEAQGLKPVINVLSNLASRGQNLRPVFRKIGEIMVGGITENFEEEGRPNKWQKRSSFTNESYGNKAYDNFTNTKRGKQLMYNSLFGENKRSSNALDKKKSSIFDSVSSNKILQNSGRLKQSINFEANANSVAVGSTLIYARIHQFGGVIKPKNGNCLCIPVGGGKIIKVKSVKIPARPYLVITDKENRQIVSTVKDFYKEVLSNGNR